MSNRGTHRKKKKSYQKRNRIVFLVFVLIILLTYIVIKKREDESYASTTSVSISEIIDIIEDGQANVSRYIVYGTHLNLEGSINITNSEIENSQIVAKKASGEEVIVDTMYEYEKGKLSFSTLDKINTGLNLEALDIDNYYILLKVTKLI